MNSAREAASRVICTLLAAVGIFIAVGCVAASVAHASTTYQFTGRLTGGDYVSGIVTAPSNTGALTSWSLTIGNLHFDQTTSSQINGSINAGYFNFNIGSTSYGADYDFDPSGFTMFTVYTPGHGSCFDLNHDSSSNSQDSASCSMTTGTPSAPTVVGISPSSGTILGGTSITISGTNFTGASAVTIGGVAATSVVVMSATSITAVTGAHPTAGAVSVDVTTPGGTNSANTLFTYFGPAPTVTALSPATGTALGGTSVTITGTNFAGATGVKFGGTDAASFSVAGATSITATSPTGSGTVDITVTTPDGTSATGAADRFTYFSGDSAVSVNSSLNPSEHGQMVIFTASVSAASTPTGTMTFKDGSTVLGSTTLDGTGKGQLGTSSLSVGVHSITVTYNGDGNFSATTSPALSQTVNVPAASVKVEQVQNQATLVVAQASGQAIDGAIEDGIADGFGGGGGAPVTIGANGFALNFAADPQARRREAALTALGYVDGQTRSPSVRDRRWDLWASLRGTGWNGHGVAAGIDGLQINATGGIGLKLTPDLLLGIVGGYEHFTYDVSALGGRLAGNGGSAGAYLAWRFGTGLRFNAAAVWSGLAYKAAVGAATGAFTGSRWLVSAGLSGSQRYGAFVFQPSARVYALWEREGAWTDSLATVHPQNSFASGRASLGGKLAYTWLTPAGNRVTPYVGGYGDYRFSSDSTTVGSADVTTDRGWSARVAGGVNVTSAHGAALDIDGELGGFGSDYLIWSAHARADVAF